VVLSVGAGDRSARGKGTTARSACCSRAARALWVHLGLAVLGQRGPGVSLVLCLVDDRSSAVEVGSSLAAAKLPSLVPAISCTTTLHAMRHWSRRDRDVDHKTVVALASGRRSSVLALLCV
jgi:hypothetical protein